MPDPSRLLTVSQTARELGVHPDTVYRRVQSGEWPAVRLGTGPKAHIRLDADELAARLVAPFAPSPDSLTLEAVAARIGKPIEWVLARTRTLPCIDGRYVDEADLREWLRAAAGEPETRAELYAETWGGDPA